MEAHLLEPAAQRRFTRHRVSWPARLTLEDGHVLEGIARDYCSGGTYLAVDGKGGRALPGVGARGQLKLTPEGVAPAVLRVEVRQASQGGLGMMFVDAAESETARLLTEATRPQAAASLLGPEARALRDALRSMLQKNFEQWGPLWLAALKQRLFRVAAEAPSSLQHRLMDVHQSLEAATPSTLSEMVRTVLERFDDPSKRPGQKEPPPEQALDSTADSLQFSLVDHDEFEDFLAEADLASRLEAAHRNLLFKVNAMLVAALGAGFDTSEGPLSPQALVRGLWLAVQGRTAEVAVRQVAQSLFNEMFVSRIGEFYEDCSRRLVEAGFAREAELRPVVKRSSSERLKAQNDLWGQNDAGADEAAEGPVPGRPPAAPAADPRAARQPAAPDLSSTKGYAPFAHTLPGGVGAPAGRTTPPGFWTIEDLEGAATGQAFDQTIGNLAQTHSFAGGAAGSGGAGGGSGGPVFIGQAQAEALRRLYSRVGAGSGGMRGPAGHGGASGAGAAGTAGGHGHSHPPAHAFGGDFPAVDPNLELPVGSAWGEAVGALPEVFDTESTLTPYQDLPHPAIDVAGGFVNDFLGGLAHDPRVGPGARAALEGLRPVIESAVAHNPAALTDPTHPVRRVASALSRLVWTEGEQAIAPCGLDVPSLVERLTVPGKASHSLFTEVARELEGTLVQQREEALRSADRLVRRHAEELAIVHARRRPEELHGALAEQVPEALEPWVQRAQRMEVGDEVLQHRPKQPDLLMRLAWIGDERRQFAFVDPAAQQLHGMTLQELALQLMRGRIEPVAASDEPVPQALLSMVDAADARLQAAVGLREGTDVWSEVGLLRALDGLVPERAGDGQPLDARLARWRARTADGTPVDWSPLLAEKAGALPEGARFGVLDDGDLVAYAAPGAAETLSWTSAIQALTDGFVLPDQGGLPAVAIRRFRPGEEQPQGALERLDLALGGIDPDAYLDPSAEELLQAIEGTGAYTIVSDVSPLRSSEEALEPAVASGIVPRLLEGLPVNTAAVNADARLAAAWDRWILDQAIDRSLSEGEGAGTVFHVPVSDLALADDRFVDDVGTRLLESGVTPARLIIELGIAAEAQHEALQNTVAALQAYGCRVSLRYRHGIGLTASLLRRSGVSSLRLPDWLAEAGKPSTERTMLVQSLVDLCRFIDIRSLAVVPEGSPMVASLRQLGIDWIQQLGNATDGTVRLTRRPAGAPSGA